MLCINSRTITTSVSSIIAAAALICFLAIPPSASAQENLELTGGWTHITGNFGQDGFNFGAGWDLSNRVQIAADYDTAWKNSPIGTFQNTPIGQVSVKNHLQNWLFGPRVFLATREIKDHPVDLFGEAQFGWSHQSASISAPAAFSTISTTDTAFTWMLGGGAEYVFASHWSARGKLDFVRTHFADSGQSRLRIGVGVTYTFANRENRTRTR